MFHRDRVFKLLEEKGWTKYRLAKEANIPQSSLHDILSGRIKNPTGERLKAIADALGISVDDFFDEDKNITAKESTDKYNPTKKDSSEMDEVDELEQEFEELKDKMKNISPSKRKKILKMIELFEEDEDEE